MMCFGTSKILGIVEKGKIVVLGDYNLLQGYTFEQALNLSNSLESIQAKGKPRRSVVATFINGRPVGYLEKIKGAISTRLIF